MAGAAIIFRCTSYLFDCFQSTVVHHFTITQAAADSFFKKMLLSHQSNTPLSIRPIRKKSPGDLFWSLTIFIPSLIIHPRLTSVETRARGCEKGLFRMINKNKSNRVSQKSITDIPPMVYFHSVFPGQAHCGLDQLLHINKLFTFWNKYNLLHPQNYTVFHTKHHGALKFQTANSSGLVLLLNFSVREVFVRAIMILCYLLKHVIAPT